MPSNWTVSGIGTKGVRLTGSPNLYEGADLKTAQNTVVDREGTLQGLTRRPGLEQINSDSLLGGGRIYGMISVPIEIVPAKVFLPTNLSWFRGDMEIGSLDPITSLARYCDLWTDRVPDIYPLHLADSSLDTMYYVVQESASDSPAIAVSDGVSSIPAYHFDTSLITSVRTLNDDDGNDIIYVAEATFDGASGSSIGVWKIDTQSGFINQVGPTIEAPIDTIVTDIADRNGEVLILVAGELQDSELYSITNREGDGWRLKGRLAGLTGLSMIEYHDTGNIWIGGSNSPDTSNQAKIYFIDSSGDIQTSDTATGTGYSFYAGLTLYRDVLYAVKYESSPEKMVIIKSEDAETWEEDQVIIGSGAIYSQAEHVGQMQAIEGKLYLCLPGSTNGALLVKNDPTSDWEVLYSGYAYRGPIVGVR